MTRPTEHDVRKAQARVVARMMTWKPPTTKPDQREHVNACVKLLRYARDGNDWKFVDVVMDGLVALQRELRNRSSTKKGRPTADSVTPAKRAEVLRLREEQPTLSQQEIANRTNVNIGRVSEILHGKRGAAA